MSASANAKGQPARLEWRRASRRGSCRWRLIYQPTFLAGDVIRAGRLVPLPLEHPTFDRLAVGLGA